MSYFVNYSNHPSSAWSSDQIAAAHKYGEITDIPFPNVSASSGEEEILQTAKDGVERIMRYNPAAVLVQGEFTLTYSIVSMLLEKKVKVLAGCSERRTEEWTEPDGSSMKKAAFVFVRFREYR